MSSDEQAQSASSIISIGVGAESEPPNAETVSKCVSWPFPLVQTRCIPLSSLRFTSIFLFLMWFYVKK